MSFLGGLIDSFTGKGARKDIDKGIGAVNEKTGKSVAALQQGGADALGYMKDYRDQGGSAFKMYGDTLGVNGTGARDTAQNTYLSDPILQKQLELQQKQRGWSSNSRGGYGSGADTLAASRVNLQGYGDWQNRLAGAGQQGQAAAGASADIAQRTAAGEAGAYGAGSGAVASLYGERAKTENALAQNGLGVAGLFTKYMGYGSNDLSRRGGSGTGSA